MAHLMHFNRAAIEGIENPVGKDREEYRDKKEGGLYLYVSRGGAKTFHLYQKFRSRPLRIKIGRYPEFSVSAAREKARELKGQLARGENPAAKSRKTEAEHVTIGQIGDAYIQTRKLSKNSRTLYEGRLNKQLKTWQKLPIVEISKDQLVRLHGKIADDSGRHMADLTMRVFGAFFNFFMDRYDYPGPNPVKTLSANKLWKTNSDDRRTTYISKEDLPKWFQTVQSWELEVEQDYLLLLLFTGMRKSETARLCWEDVDFKKRMFTVKGAETKNGKPLELPFNRVIAETFERLRRRKSGDWVFPSERDANKPINVNLLAKRVSKASGIKFELHDLRRTFLTYVEALDFSQYVLKRLVNHAPSGDVTEGYIIPDVDRLREPSEKIAQHILELAKAKM